VSGARLRDRGVAARTAAFSSPSPDEDVVRLAAQERANLLITDAGLDPLDGAVVERAPCDVAMLVRAAESLQPGPVVVPFGAAWHDWAALELGAWVARAADRPLRLIGAAGDHRNDRRDASRLLADASLIVQRQTGVMAGPLLARPGRSGVMALAEGAGLLVVGLSDRWSDEGLGPVRARLVEAPPAPTVLVRRGGATGMAPEQAPTRFGWSLTVGGP
jgi:hypothetical protein